MYLFPTVLADVGNIEVAPYRIERKTPGIAQSFCPDGAKWDASGGHGIIRHSVKRRRGPGLKTRVEAEHLAQQGIVALGVVLRIPAATTIAHTDVEITLTCWSFHWTKSVETTVMIGKRLRDHEEG